MPLILVAAAAVALSQGGAPAAVTAAKPGKKICRYDIATGSIMPGKRVCHTATEWRTSDDKNGEDADRFRRRPQLQAGRPIPD